MNEPNPELIWQLATAHQRTAALQAGVDLGVFDALGAGPSTAAQIAAKAGVAVRGMRILCDSLTIFGLIGKDGDRYVHSPTSAVFLDSASPASMATMIRFMTNDKIWTASRLLTKTIRAGHTALPQALAGDEVKEWVTFAETMQPMMAAAAEFIAGKVMEGGSPAKVLDVAASHGLFGLAVKRRAPDCEVVAQDFPSVLEVTQRHAAAAGLGITPLPGSAFTVDLGDGYDALLVTNLYHHFSEAENVALMKRFHAALRPGGRMFILEMVPNEDRVTPPAPASFAMMMLANTAAGDAFTMADYSRMLDAAGFGARELMNVPQSAQQLVIAVK